MLTIRTALASVLAGALLLAGCGTKPAPPKPSAPGGATQPAKAPQHPELVHPFEQALLALKAMNEAGRQKDLTAAGNHFRDFRTQWEAIRVKLRAVDPGLEQHLEDGARELDHEFTKPADQIRAYELEEETVKLGRLLASGADQLHVPINADLVQKAPTVDLPFNKAVRVAVTLSEHKILPEMITLEQHTKVTFAITNKGKEVHEFELGHYAIDAEDVKPGETREITLVLLDAGEFETSCHVPGHYEVGMHGTLIVTPAILQPR